MIDPDTAKHPQDLTLGFAGAAPVQELCPSANEDVPDLDGV